MSRPQNPARADLASRHYEEYRSLYLEEKEALLKENNPRRNINSTSQFRAYTELSKMYPEEYAKLYQHYKKLLTPAK